MNLVFVESCAAAPPPPPPWLEELLAQDYEAVIAALKAKIAALTWRLLMEMAYRRRAETELEGARAALRRAVRRCRLTSG